MDTTIENATGPVQPDLNTLLQELAHFTGDLDRHRHWTGRVIYTPGIHHLAERAGAYWLIDLIASWQLKPRVACEAFQVWSLLVRDDRTAVASVTDGNENALASQDIAHTDFPHGEIDLWLVHGTLLLPGEY